MPTLRMNLFAYTHIITSSFFSHAILLFFFKLNVYGHKIMIGPTEN
jgi:hypothetical protein